MAANRPAYVQFYPSDWKGGTANLSPSAEWTYLQICLHNWDKAEAMPATLCKLYLKRNAEWEADLALLVETGQVTRTAGGHYFVSRALREAERSVAAWNKKRRAGREGAKKRWGDDSPAEGEGEAPAEDDGSNGDLIFSIPKSAMAEFRSHRRNIGSPLTPEAERRLLKKLETLQREGNDPVKMLEQSIDNGWRGVFPVKGEGDGRAGQGRNGLFDASGE